jgi:hypothetical protein
MPHTFAPLSRPSFLPQVPVVDRQRSSTGWLLIAVNAPASKRHEPGYAALLSIVGSNVKLPGQEHKPMDHSHMLQLIRDELDHLDKVH